MDAFIGLSGVFLILIVFPAMSVILIIKAIKKTSTKIDIIKPFVILVIGIILFFIGLYFPSSVDENIESEKDDIVELNTSKEVSTFSLEGKVKGEYGKYDNFNEKDYIRYYIPSGKYYVKCNSGGVFRIETIELHKEDNRDFATIISEHIIKTGEIIEIDIEDGQCINLILNTKIKLTKIQ